MEDKFISPTEIKEELHEVERLGRSLARNLSLLAQKIKYILEQIKSCDSLDSAQGYFDLLDNIQLALARLIFREEIGIPNELNNFVRICDRLDDSWLREYLFNQIKKGKNILA